MYIAILLKKIMPYAFFLIGFGYTIAQDENQGEMPSIQMILEQNGLIAPEIEGQVEPSSSNSAYIYQIGVNNESLVKVNGANNNVSLLQNGNSNRADIQLSSKTLDYNTVQNGNGNILLEYGNAPNLNLQRTIFQNGDNQNVVIFGSNSLTKNMVLNVQGNLETVTIRNFN
nr:hypothetical protein [Zobellia laminariae]